MKHVLRWLLLCVSALILTNCTSRYTQIPKLNIAGVNIQSNNFSVKDYVMDKEIESEDFFNIVFIIPIQGYNQKLYYGMIDNAVQNICKERGLDFMTNVKVYVSSWYIPYIFGKVTFKVIGEGWKKKENAKLVEELNNFGTAYLLEEEK